MDTGRFSNYPKFYYTPVIILRLWLTTNIFNNILSIEKIMRTRLAKFTVSGFRNFSKPLTLDFTLVRDYTFNRECIDNGIITKMGIYGPNGSGKSNLGIALFSIVSVLTDKWVENESVNPSLFLNADSKTEEAIFQYDFIQGKNKFTFIYSKQNENNLLYESLAVNDEIIYDYNYKAKSFSTLKRGSLISKNLNFEYLSENLSILRYLANNSNQKEDSPIRSIMDFASHMLWFRSVRVNSFIGFESSPTLLDDWIINNGLVGDFNSFLKDTCALNIKLQAIKTADGRMVLAEKHQNGYLMFNQAYSSGTSAAELFYFWMKRFNSVSFLFMDEFDAYYHFALSERIIEKLKTYTEMQAIFTTHNSSLLSNRLLRPDCYFFLENGSMFSYLEKAENREIREGHNLEKIYRAWSWNE